MWGFDERCHEPDLNTALPAGMITEALLRKQSFALNPSVFWLHLNSDINPILPLCTLRSLALLFFSPSQFFLVAWQCHYHSDWLWWRKCCSSQIGGWFSWKILLSISPPYNHTHFNEENTFSSLSFCPSLCGWVWVMGAFPALSQIQESAHTMADVSERLGPNWLNAFSALQPTICC